MRLNDLQRRKIFGLSVVISDGLSLINKFIEHLTAHEGASIFFVNAYTLYLKEYDDQFARELCNADYLLNDGIGMELAARVHGVALRENLVGTDLIPRFLSNLSGLQWKPGIFLVGGNEMTARKATDYVRKHFPFLRVAGNQPGYFSKEEFGSLGYKIQMAKPDVVLVGMGQPIQENFIASIREVAPQALLFGVGGLFDYWSNNLKRAPAFVRRLRLEWLHIILRQPYKVNRYIKCIPFVLKRVFLFGMSSILQTILEKMREVARSILRRICTVLAIPVILYRKTTRKPSTCVFVYHHISDEVGVPFTVGISRFKRQMEYLSRKGIVVHPSEFVKSLALAPERHGARVLLTFDDGYSDFYVNAYPILSRLRLPCILFINTINLSPETGSPYVTSEQLGVMDPEIVTVCSHGHSHTMLSQCDHEQIRTEMELSIEILDRLPAGSVDFFAYPYGTINAFDKESVSIIKDYGFRMAFTSLHGLVVNELNPYRVPRIRVDNSDSILMYRWAIHGGLNLYRFIDLYLSRLQRVPSNRSWKGLN